MGVLFGRSLYLLNYKRVLGAFEFEKLPLEDHQARRHSMDLQQPPWLQEDCSARSGQTRCAVITIRVAKSVSSNCSRRSLDPYAA